MAQDINIYCDESRYSNPEDPYLVIGAVKCPRERKRGIVRELGALKRNNGIGGGFGGEFGWKSVSRNKAAFYTALIDWFLATDDLRFRCVVANRENLWSQDAESAFYVVYHQLLCHWLVPPNVYHVYLDEKKNSRWRRVGALRTKTAGYMLGGCGPACVGEVSSRECALARVADCLIGCMGHTWDGHAGPEGFPEGSAFKRGLCAHLRKGLGGRHFASPPGRARGTSTRPCSGSSAMVHTTSGDGLPGFSGCESDEEKLDQCWDYFCVQLGDIEVRAFDGKLVRGFTEVSFEHIVSGSSNKWDTARGHDIGFVERRARCLPLIGKVIRGEIKSRCWRVSMQRGKKLTTRKILTVIEIEHEYFVVVMAEAKDRYAILTAYPSNREHYDHCIKNHGVNMGIWGEGR